MNKKNQLRISQCMIVKNEEKNIRQALTWGKEIMWEQIVVDTGSTDKTVELAKALGAKVAYYTWTDDFAAAKNYAISQAKGDWIALLDADEYMTAEDAKKVQLVLEEMAKKGFDGLSTGWQQLNDEGQIFSSGTQVRFFRNDPDIRYRRRIHEQLEAVSGRKLRIGDATQDLSIFHTGYQTNALRGKVKSGRNRKLILEELKEHPEDAEMMGYMGDDCLSDGDKQEAEIWYRRAVEHMPLFVEDYDQRSAVTLTNLLKLLTDQIMDFAAEKSAIKENAVEDRSAKKNLPKTLWEEITAIYEKAVKLLPQESDFDYILGRCFASQGQAGQAVAYLETALNKLTTYGCYNKALLLAANVLDAYDVLVRCCYEIGEQQKCVSYAVNYLKYNPYGMGVLSRLLKTLLPEARETEIEQQKAVFEVLSKLYDFSALKDRLFLVKTAEKADRREFSIFLANQFFSPEEQKGFGFGL